MAQSLRSTDQRASRHAKPARSYEEPLSDIDEELYYQALDSESSRTRSSRSARKSGPAQPAAKSTTPVTKRKRGLHLLSTSKSSHGSPRTSKRQRGAVSIPRKRIKSQIKRASPPPSLTQHDSHSAGVIPEWSSLPYAILLQIFQYASYPLHDQFFQTMHSAEWLLRISRLCRAFSEPALTALYMAPPLVPMERAHKLRQLLITDQEAMSFKYRQKVQHLEMEVSHTLAYTLTHWGVLDLHGIIFNCPRLVDLEFYHALDNAPYRSLEDSIKWNYPEGMFEALANNVEGLPTRLRSWRWNSRLAGKRWPVEKMKEIHLSPSFQNLRKIAIVNYQVPKARKGEDDQEHHKIIAESLSVLPKLEHVILECSTIVDSRFLPLLPTALKHLEMINCWEVDQYDMLDFLSDHGNYLESLVLKFNQSLNLGFLTILARSCPRLKSLKMDMRMYHIHTSYIDNNPLFKELFAEDQIPQWPASLEEIEFEQLRKWDTKLAEIFFRSLLEKGDSLPNLRRLTITCILTSVGWRERSAFRDEWGNEFDRVFKRAWRPPNPDYTSFGAINHSKQQRSKQQREILEEADNDDSQPLRLHRLTAPQKRGRYYESSEGEIDQDEAPLSVVRRRSNRAIMHNTSRSNIQPIAPKNAAMSRELQILHETAGSDAPSSGENSAQGSSRETSIEISSDESANDGSDDEPLAIRTKHQKTGKKVQRLGEFARQSMCDVVNVRIDNLRPTENPFREEDFLDSEPEGDSDWDGDDVEYA